MFVTFYSYKGGVGRSLALANVACLMAGDTEHPQRVLVWDFDLEAPGLHRLFPPKQPQPYGFVDLVYEYATTGNIPEIKNYIYESDISGVYVLPAGKMGGTYCQKLQKIDWLKLFGSDIKDPGPFFGELLKSVKNMPDPFDYVLIDSRTGLNDQAGICTQVLSDILIVLFRLTEQNIDGLEHLIPTIRSQFKMREKENTQILPIASQVRAVSLQEQAIRKKTVNIFERELEYIRFDEDLVSREILFCLPEQIGNLWPSPPIIDDYKRICANIRSQNKDDTRTTADELRLRMQEGDIATASMKLLRLLPRRPRLHEAWRTLSYMFEQPIPESRRQEFQKVVSKILRDDPENFLAHQWKAAFQSSKADRPESAELKKAKNSLNKALKYSPELEKGNIFRALASIESAEGHHENAITFLRKAQELLPGNNQVNLDLAMLHMRMGAKYFAVAAQELDEITPDIGDQKYTPLAYIRAFLEEREKAANALKSCDKYMKPLIELHMLLIQGKKQEAIQLADKYAQSLEDLLEPSNLAEFYLCAEAFDQVISICKKHMESKRPLGGNLRMLKGLAELLKKKGKTDVEKISKLATHWGKTSWNFRELLMFRECCIRDGKDYGNTLNLIERIIQFQELNQIISQGIGLFKSASLFRGLDIKLEVRKT